MDLQQASALLEFALPWLKFAGQLMLWGWGLAVVAMIIGMFLLLISKPWTAQLDIPEGVDTSDLDDKVKAEFNQYCYERACDDLVFNSNRNGKEQKLTHIDNKNGTILYPMEWQLTMWHKLFDWFLFPNHPSFLAQILNIVLVTPFTNITALSLHYQMYLNEIFHTRFFSRGIHFLMMPFITWVYLLFGAWFSLNDVCTFLHLPHTNLAEIWKAFLIEHVGDNYLVGLLELNGGFAIFLSFVIWYFLWGLVSKAYALGFAMAPIMGVLWVVANGFSQLTRFPTGGEWYWHSPWWANWIILGCFFAFIQAFSHTPEPLPPRVNRTAHWMSLAHFFQLNKHRPVMVLFVVVGQAIFGTFDEFWAGPRLLPLLVLKVLYMLGYNKDQWRTIYKVSNLARKIGNPALDYIGVGGANQPSKEEKDIQAAIEFHPPATFHDARKEKDRLQRIFKGTPEDKLPKNKSDKNYKEYLQYKAYRSLVLRTKANRYAFGPFVANSKDRKVQQAQLAKLTKKDLGGHIFLDLVREDLFRVEAKRQTELYNFQNQQNKKTKKRN